MNSRRKISEIALIVCCALALAACGDSSKSTTTVPSAPNPADGNTTPINTSNPGSDPRLPDLTRSAQILLVDNTNYSGLQDLAGIIYPPVIGMPLLQLTLTDNAQAHNTEGTLLFAFEQDKSVWGAQLPSAPLSGTRTSTYLDKTFSDSGFSLRVTGNVSSAGLMSGSVYYRIRHSGEYQCLPIQCVQWDYTTNSWKNATCTQDLKLQAASACNTYMFEGSPGVTLLGTYKDFDFASKWVK